MTSFSVRYPEIGRCICGAVLHVDSFRDDASYRAFYLSGLCQKCSDESTFVASESEPGMRFPLRRGALVAHSCREGGGVELGILPFVFVLPEPRFAWEARFAVRLGRGLDPLDPFDELLPMKDHLAGHQIRVYEGVSLDEDGGPARHLAALDLLIGLEQDALEVAIDTGAFPSNVPSASLVDFSGWRRDSRRPSSRSGHWWPYGDVSCSVLRTCALMGLLLCQPDRDGEEHSLFRRVLRTCGAGPGGANEVLL